MQSPKEHQALCVSWAMHGGAEPGLWPLNQRAGLDAKQQGQGLLNSSQEWQSATATLQEAAALHPAASGKSILRPGVVFLLLDILKFQGP